MPLPRPIAHRLYSFVRSDGFFYLALGCLVLSAAYIALTSIFPMAFDEEFHIGLIKIYATSWLPYGIEHTSDMAVYGPATADASYLFQYVMSFPYRLLAFLGLPFDGIVIVLRLLNIAMVAGSMIVFRRALLEATLQRGVVNVGLAFIMSIPVFVLLAAHVNYDNLLLLVLAWCMLLLVRITGRALQPRSFVRLRDVWLLAVALLIGMSIKYAFLPLALVLGVWAAYYILRDVRLAGTSSYWRAARREWGKITRPYRYFLLFAAFISIFFAAHYVTNLVSYGSPIPACDQVFTETECQAYGPWNRNQMYQAMKSSDFRPLSYPTYMVQEWFPGMAQRLTFAVAGKTNGFQTKLSLPLVVNGYVFLSIVGALCLLIQIARKRISWLSVFTVLLSLTYVGILSIQLYSDYCSTGQPVAINGRYLLPLLPLVSVSLIQAMRQTLRGVSSPVLAVITLIAFVYFIISGAGVITYIILSESHWYWSGAAQVVHARLQTYLEWIVWPIRYTP